MTTTAGRGRKERPVPFFSLQKALNASKILKRFIKYVYRGYKLWFSMHPVTLTIGFFDKEPKQRAYIVTNVFTGTYGPEINQYLRVSGAFNRIPCMYVVKLFKKFPISDLKLNSTHTQASRPGNLIT